MSRQKARARKELARRVSSRAGRPKEGARRAGTINAYACSACRAVVVTRHRDTGQAPSFIPCPRCPKTAESLGYHRTFCNREPVAEWFAPSLEGLEDHVADYVRRGGLVLRYIGPTADQLLTEAAMAEETYWNGEPALARRCVVLVGQSDAPAYWARDLVGQERQAVEVTYGDHVFLLDNEDGFGWHKVTKGHGSPRHGHRNLTGTVLRYEVAS